MNPQWDQQYLAGQGRYFPNEELVRFLGRTYGSSIDVRGLGLTAVDLGCGVGGNVRALAEWGFFTYGLESSVVALRLAQNYAEKKGYAQAVHYEHYRAPECMSIPAGSVNLVIDIQTMQHLNAGDHMAMYREIYRVLTPGGKFFSVHWMGSTGAVKAAFPDHPELVTWSDVSFFWLVGKSGLTIVADAWQGRSYSGQIASWSVFEAVKP